MVTFEKELSSRLVEGKCQILIRANITRTNRPRFKSGVFVSPNYFKNGEIHIPKKSRNTIAEAEALMAQQELANFCQMLTELIECSLIHLPEVNKEFLSAAIEAVNKGTLPYNGHGFRFSELQEVLFPREVIVTPIARKKVEMPKIKKTFYKYITEYCTAHHISPKRCSAYNTMARLIYRFELYQQMIEKRKLFYFDYETLTKDDLFLLRNFILNEHTISLNYPKQYEQITQKVTEQFPMRHIHISDFKYSDRSENYVIRILTMTDAVLTWIREDLKLTRNDPFRGLNIGTEQVQAHPIFITIEERNKLADYPFEDRFIEEQRDIFIFQCLIGCRYSDLVRLTEKNIHNGVLVYLAQKTRKNVQPAQPRIPLGKRAVSLIEKYRGVCSKGRLFPFVKNNTYNGALKTAFKEAGLDRMVYVLNPRKGIEEPKPLYEVASSHMARRTFIGNAYKLVKDPSIICSMSGHVEGSRAFARYRDIDDDIRKEVIDKIE